MRAGVDLLDDRVFFVGVKVGRPKDHSEDVGLVVATFGRESFGWLPTGGEQRGPVGSFEFTDQRSVFRATQFRDRRQIDSRVHVDQQLAIG